MYSTHLTPLMFLERSAYVFRDKTAVVYKDKRFTYKEFCARVNRMASSLRDAGIEKGDRVSFICRNTPPLLEAHFGVPLAGASLVPINIRLSSREISYIVNHSGSKAFFVDTSFTDLITPIKEELSTVNIYINISKEGMHKKLPGPEYEEFLSEGSEEHIEIPVEDENEVITINYTSGTTGLPKGCMYTHRGAYLNAIGEALELGMNSDTVYLWTLPMFHCNGWCFTWGATSMGGTHICLDRVDPLEVYRLIERERVTHLCAAPVIYIILSEYMKRNKLRLSHKVRMAIAGAPPPPAVIMAMEELGGELIHLYGLTETYGPHTICEWKSEWNKLPIEERAKIKACQGVSYVGFETKVVDENMKEMPHDGKTIGEVVMRGNNVMKGYYKEPVRTEKVFVSGWFHSGDLAVVHPNGYIEIIDREKDIIISGGENIASVEVEKIIYEHPDVLEVAVFSTPDEKWGEAVKALITPKPGTSPTSEDIINFCRARMAHFKCPRVVEFGDIPKTFTGKMMKYILRDREWKGRKKKVG